MTSKFEPQMTDAMLKVWNDFSLEYLQVEYIFCYEKYLDAYDASDIDLPHVNERGVNVVHGARCEIYWVRDYWKNRAQVAESYLSSEWCYDTRQEIKARRDTLNG